MGTGGDDVGSAVDLLLPETNRSLSSDCQRPGGGSGIAIGSDDLTTLIRKKDGHENEVVSPKFDGSRNIRLEHRVTETYLAFIAT